MRALLLSLSLSLFACRVDLAEVNDHAAAFVAKVPGATGYLCANADTDGDGYVSCTVFRGEKDPLAVDCGAQTWCLWNCASGCKYIPYKGGR